MAPALMVSLIKRFIVTGAVIMYPLTEQKKEIPVDTYMAGYDEDEACADAAWGVALREVRGTGILLTEEMYTYNLTATEDQTL